MLRRSLLHFFLIFVIRYFLDELFVLPGRLNLYLVDLSRHDKPINKQIFLCFFSWFHCAEFAGWKGVAPLFGDFFFDQQFLLEGFRESPSHSELYVIILLLIPSAGHDIQTNVHQVKIWSAYFQFDKGRKMSMMIKPTGPVRLYSSQTHGRLFFPWFPPSLGPFPVSSPSVSIDFTHGGG